MNKIIEKNVNSKAKAFISFVLDESSSMHVGKDAIFSGMNEQIQTLKNRFKDGLIEPVVTFVKFNENVMPLYEGKSIDDLREFEPGDYAPNGSTALYDAVGYTIDKMNTFEGINDEGNSSLLIVITDGEENTSRKYNSSQISEKIQTLNNSNKWTVTYLGPNNVDLSKVRKDTSLSYGNTFSADLTSNVGYTNAFATIGSGTNLFYSGLNCAAISGSSFASSNFYVNDNTDVDKGAIFQYTFNTDSLTDDSVTTV